MTYEQTQRIKENCHTKQKKMNAMQRKQQRTNKEKIKMRSEQKMNYKSTTVLLSM